MSQSRRLRRLLEQHPVRGGGDLRAPDPRKRLAAKLGNAIAEFGATGHSLDETVYVLLRFGAQAALLDGMDEDAFVVKARDAFVDQRTARS